MDAEKQNTRSKKRKEICVQLFFALVANIVNIGPGMSLGFSAVTLPVLQNPNSTFFVTDEEASWIASIASISTPVGCIITGAILDKIGRKFTLMLVNIPCLLGWLLIAFAKDEATLSMIYAGRFFTGLATGMSSVPAAVYSAEMSSDSQRGMLVTWASIAMSLGILLVYVLGYVLQDDWRMVAAACAVFPGFAAIVTLIFLPESPTWLLSKGKVSIAEKCFKRLRGLRKKIPMPTLWANEFEMLASRFRIKDDDIKALKTRNVFRQFLKCSTIKPFVIMNFFFFFQQFSGIFVIIFYAVQVVQEAGITWDPYIVTILIGATRVIVTIVMSFFSNKYGRRPPAIVSGAGMTICMGFLAIYLYLQDTNQITEESAKIWGWIPITSLIMYILTSTIGFLTLPWAMIGEVFPSEVRGLAAGTTTCIAYIFNFVIVKVYPNMVISLTKYGVFFFYGAFSVAGTAFVTAFLPETQGKTLSEIEDSFKNKKPKKPAPPEETEPKQNTEILKLN